MHFFFGSNVFFQGLAFTREERQLLGIHGLFPAVVQTEEEQVKHAVLLLDRYENDLDKFIYLISLYVSRTWFEFTLIAINSNLISFRLYI